jgi:hypothetical protein
MNKKAKRDLLKLYEIREIIVKYKKGDYGDGGVTAPTAALYDIIEIAKEDE